MKHSLVRRVLSLALSCGWPIHRFIVNNVFLHGTLSETIYCAQLTGLRTTLILIRYVSYGLKEAPRAWHSRFEVCFLSATVLQLNFVEAKSNTSMFMYHKDKDMVYLLYVEDIVLMAFPQHLLHVSGALRQEFSLKDLDMLHHLVCMSSTLALVFLSHQ